MKTHFTYGSDHEFGTKGYTTIEGVDHETARKIQFALHGDQWSFDYPDNFLWEQMIEKYNMECAERVVISHA